jgi:hypothetical protein
VLAVQHLAAPGLEEAGHGDGDHRPLVARCEQKGLPKVLRRSLRCVRRAGYARQQRWRTGKPTHESVRSVATYLRPSPFTLNCSASNASRSSSPSPCARAEAAAAAEAAGAAQRQRQQKRRLRRGRRQRAAYAPLCACRRSRSGAEPDRRRRSPRPRGCP